MSEYILDILNQNSKLDWAFPFQRTGAFPLDRSSLFSSITDAQNYAKGIIENEGPTDERGLAGTSYVGQTVSVYDEINNIVTLFIITPDRELKEIGNSSLGDNISIEILNNQIQLKDFGKGYYSYIPAEVNNNGEIISESKYIYTEGFKEGLEPKVSLDDNNQLVLGWYEPSNETVEEISLVINNLINEFEKTKNIVGTPKEENESATGLFKLLEDKVDSSDVYTKEEVYTKTEVLKEIANADHLKRVKVDSKDDIDVNDKKSENVIYMVPTGFQSEDDKYDEYIILDGQIEKVGSWEVDLSDYVKEKDISILLDKKVDKVEGSRLITAAESEKLRKIADEAEKNFITAVDSNFSVVDGQLNLNLLAQSKIDGLVSDLDTIVKSIENKVEKENGSRLIHSEEIDKLVSIKDLIKNIDTEKFSLSENGTLLLNSIEITKIEGLVDALSNKVDKSPGARLITKEEADKLEALSVDEDGSVGISASVNASKVQELYNAIVTIVTGVGTGKYDGEFKNLLGIEPGAEKNFISSVESDFSVTEGLLKLKSVPMSKVTGLSTELGSKANVSQIEDIEDYLNTQLTLHEERFESIEQRLTWKQI